MYVGLLAFAAVLAVVAAALLKDPGGLRGITPGHSLAPFAVPLAGGTLTGDANVATHANQGEAGRVPACTVRGRQVLNICQLSERGPVVLALFVNGGSCPRVLSEMQALTGSFPGVQFAAVSIKGSRPALRALLRRRAITLPVGFDADGALQGMYKVFSCPQVSFAYPGGKVESQAMLSTPTPAALRARVAGLVAGSKARGWREPAR
jgi:hypothetical protein